MTKKSTATRNKKIAAFFAEGISCLFMPFGKSRQAMMLGAIAECLPPVVSVPVNENTAIKFWCPGGWSAYRAQSLKNKEPETIRWIESFKPDSVFWDIGANVGVFTLYASVVKGAKTYAFEPSLANIAVLTRNLELNKVDGKVVALPVALGAKTGLDYLSMSATEFGNTGGQYGRPVQGIPTSFRQACLGFTIDDFVVRYALPIPAYIKMDVDGLEIEILKGASRTLYSPEIKSIILEAESGSSELSEIRDLLGAHGFKITNDSATVSGKEKVRNYIFERS